MSSPSSITRRQLLGLLSASGIGGLAGCGGHDGTLDSTSSAKAITSPTTSTGPNSTTVTPTEKPVLQLPWRQLPGPPGGPVTDIGLSRADPEWIYATTKTAGILVSSDGGANWTQGLSGMHHRNWVNVSPHDPIVAYAQERTSDGGRHWWDKRNPEKHRFPPIDGQIGVSDIEWSPFSEDTLYAATVEGLYRTYDDGQHWELIPIEVQEGDRLTNIAVHPKREGVLIAGLPKTGVAKSVDRGESWRLIPGSETLPDQFFKGLEFGTVPTVDIFLAKNGHGVYRLSGGEVEEITAGMQSLAFPAGSANFSAIEGSVYFIAGRLNKSVWNDRKLYHYDSNAGELNTIETPVKPSAFASQPNEPSTIYFGGESWVYASNNQGESWEKRSNGFIDGYLATVEVNPSNPETVIPGSLCSSGISVSRDHGLTFEWKRSGLEPWHGGKFGEHYVKQIRAFQDYVYATTGSGLLISTDNGATWELLDTRFSGKGGHTPREPFTPLHGLAIHPADPKVVIVGSGRKVPGDVVIDQSLLWKSTDGGDNWQEISNGFPTEAETIVRDVVFCPDDNAIVYAATLAESVLGGEGEAGEGVGIYKSGNGGVEWQALDTPFENVHALSITPSNPTVLYASTPQGVYRSTNRGIDWESVLDYETRALLAHPTEPGVVLAGAKKYEKYWDVLVSVNGGETWTEGNLTIQIGLEADEREYDAADIHSDYWNERGEIEWFAYDQSNSLVYAATRGTGLWRADTEILE